MIRTNSQFRPRVELLEDRMLMAGNVTASVIDGNLFITGDAADNHIRIEPATTGRVRISGVGTTVNGGASFEATYTGRLDIRLKEGNDHVEIGNGVNVPRSLIVFGGAGDDRLECNFSYIGRHVNYFGGPGDDRLEVGASGIGGNLNFLGGLGNDHVDMDLASVDDAVFNLGLGTAVQEVNLYGTYIFGNLSVLSQGETPDEIFMDSCALFGASTMALAGGDDRLYVDNSDILGAFRADLGAGDDTVNLELDQLEPRPLTFVGPVTIRGGDGADIFILGVTGNNNSRAVFNSQATLDGGLGLDLLLDRNSQGPLVTAGFEP